MYSLLLFSVSFCKKEQKTEQQQKVYEETVTEQGSELVTQLCYFGHRGIKWSANSEVT
jgi:hypothetical protein